MREYEEGTDSDVEAFLKELAELTKKYNISIGGCGECGSPWLYKKGGDDTIDYLFWNESKQIYTIGYMKFDN